MLDWLQRLFRPGLAAKRIPAGLEKYVPEDLLKALEHAPSPLGGQQVVATILVCVAPSLETEAGSDLKSRNAILTVFVDAVIKHEGLLDKFLFNGFVAFWNASLGAPDHARQACDTALEIAGRHGARCAVNTGEMVVGNIGSDQRMDYTAIGDPVTVAYRLADFAHWNGHPILVGEQTFVAIRNSHVTEALGDVRLEGRVEPVTAHRLLGRRDQA